MTNHFLLLRKRIKRFLFCERKGVDFFIGGCYLGAVKLLQLFAIIFALFTSNIAL